MVKGGFYIHAGPESVQDSGWGSAGCVEILGNFDAFKKDVLGLAGSTDTGSTAAINAGMSKARRSTKLFVTYGRRAVRTSRRASRVRVDPDALGTHDSHPTRSPRSTTHPATSAPAQTS